jgi:hypothetical protein
VVQPARIGRRGRYFQWLKESHETLDEDITFDVISRHECAYNSIATAIAGGCNHAFVL